ncbi:MAG: tRNA (N(6)-L-threonylcarbamoyladenosine(37)-C(2))-methylthiotransferase [Methanosarcinales archaeon]|nr:tRNA (N(6)-L-threonylcarbamoyladenosine(37)-C(2))-methylthiotransferase [Methanosarcinales archaeon]
MKIHIKTFGCTANRADSHRIMQLLASEGHVFIDNPDLADLVVVNTCTVTQTTQQKVLKYINSVSDLGKDIVVAGCLPAAQPDILDGINYPSVTPASLDNITDIVGSNIVGSNGITAPALYDVPIMEGVTGIVSISQGCIGQCSYCIVKQARGKLVSRPVPDIVDEIRLLVQQGAREIQLTSQDTSAYGMDMGIKLPELLRDVTTAEGDYMIRVGMMNPFTVIDIIDDVIESFKNSHIFKFLHIPIQSGSDRVLQHMNRKHTSKEFKHIIDTFRNNFPGMVISTDFIVGYPTETEQDFIDTLELLKEIRPQKVNITRYSPRPNTPSSKLRDLPSWKKKERSRRLTEVHHTVNRELLRKRIGDTIHVLTTEVGKDYSTIGRDIYYNNIVVKEDLPLGNWYYVKITGSTITYLIGEIKI